MNHLITRIKSAFRRDPVGGIVPPTTRNRSGGMAWIKAAPGNGCGSEQLNGRAVKTVVLDEPGFWRIDPPQRYTATESHTLRGGHVVNKGEQGEINIVADWRLEPWKDDGLTLAEVTELYQPKPERTTA